MRGEVNSERGDKMTGPRYMNRDAKTTLILHIEVPGIWSDDLEESAREYADRGGDPTDADRLDVVLEEWMRPSVGLTLLMYDGEDPEMMAAYVGRIVGAEARPNSSEKYPNEDIGPDMPTPAGSGIAEGGHS